MLRIVCALLLLASTALAQSNASTTSIQAAADAIEPSWIAPHVRFLSDSLLAGRDTGSPGYQIGANYVAAQFESLGLKPAGSNNSYFQTVPIRKSTIAPGSAVLEIEGPTGKQALAFDKQFLVHPSGAEDAIDASGEMLFVGYGISAPEAHYDDYAGIDAHGKIVIFLPGIPASLERDVAAVHSRLAVRVANAKAHGAVAAIEIAPNGAVDALRERAIRQMDATMWLDQSGHAHNLHAGGAYAMITKEGFAAIAPSLGHSFEEIQQHLKQGPFSFAMNGRATLRAHFDHHDSKTVNVVALLPGRERPQEYVVFSAHLDHDGVSDFFPGDHVLHGALDNAGGIATILAVARASKQTQPPARSVLFLAVTGEEKGLVGSDYFVQNPTVPRNAIVADINADNFLWYAPVKDIAGIGANYSSLQQDFAAVAREMQLEVSPVIPAVPGVFTLSDHFSFLNAGIPALSVINGVNSGDGKRSGNEIWADYMRNIHHTPKDSMDQALDWNAAVTEARFAFLLGDEIAQSKDRPKLNADAFFVSTPAAP